MIELTKLFQPGMIGKMEVRNRIVMPAMGSMPMIVTMAMTVTTALRRMLGDAQEDDRS